MKGGYVLIDCKGLDLKVSSGQTITGLYNSAVSALKRGKAVFAENLKWGTDNVSPVPVFVNFDGTEDYIVCTASTLQIVVTKADAVTIINMAPSEAKSATKSSK